jgi:hypothetical protein
MIPIVCYSHSDYYDVLQVQSYYLQRYKNPKYLCYNKDVNIVPFQKVLVYDDTLNYSKRLEQCLSQINDEYIILTQDMDILISMDESMIANMVNEMKKHSIDRIDLKVQSGSPTIPLQPLCGLLKYNTPDHRFNVNPSIWKLTSILNIVRNFDKCYRTIECDEVEDFCRNYKIYRIAHYTPKRSAFFDVSPWYVYLHITSAGKLIPSTHENQMCEELHNVYLNILKTFLIQRPMKHFLYGYY